MKTFLINPFNENPAKSENFYDLKESINEEVNIKKEKIVSKIKKSEINSDPYFDILKDLDI